MNRPALQNRQTGQDYNSWGCIHNGTPAHGTVGLAADGSPGKEILAILGGAVEVEYCTYGQVGGLYPVSRYFVQQISRIA